MPKRPATQKEIVEHLWDDVRGENGGGIIALSKENHTAIGEIKEDVAYIKGKIEGLSNGAKPTIKAITLRRAAEVGVTALVLGAVGVGASMLFMGRLTATDIVNMLTAWRGGG